MKTFDRQTLDVVNQTRSNLFGWRGQFTPDSKPIEFERFGNQCRFENETVWMTQAQMAELFQTTPQNLTLHLKAILVEGELAEAATCKDYLQVRPEGRRAVSRRLRHYRLEAILAVGYRVRGSLIFGDELTDPCAIERAARRSEGRGLQPASTSEMAMPAAVFPSMHTDGEAA